jgi:hypothetical protein
MAIAIATGVLCDPGTDQNFATAVTHPDLISAICDSCHASWGDVDNSGEIEINDQLCMLAAYAGCFDSCPPPATLECTPACFCSLYAHDLAPCPFGDGYIDVADILRLVDAANHQPYPCALSQCSGDAALQTPALGGDSMNLTDSEFDLTRCDPNFDDPEALVIEVSLTGPDTYRCYQVDLDWDGGLQGTLELESITIDPSREDFPFAGLDHVTAFDLTRGRMAACLHEGHIAAMDQASLATFRFRATPDALGPFSVRLSDHETRLLDEAGGTVPVTTTTNGELLIMIPGQP